jgi:hypothetical protein
LISVLVIIAPKETYTSLLPSLSPSSSSSSFSSTTTTTTAAAASKEYVNF